MHRLISCTLRWQRHTHSLDCKSDEWCAISCRAVVSAPTTAVQSLESSFRSMTWIGNKVKQRSVANSQLSKTLVSKWTELVTLERRRATHASMRHLALLGGIAQRLQLGRRSVVDVHDDRLRPCRQSGAVDMTAGLRSCTALEA